mgnify:CR=1 FL=1
MLMNLPFDSIYLAIWSSIGDAEEIFDSAQKFLEQHGVKILRKSSNYLTEPYGWVAKNMFTNAVWEIDFTHFGRNQELGIRNQASSPDSWLSTSNSPEYQTAIKLLSICQACEAAHGRTREKRWGDRTLDIDILTFWDLRCETDELTIPHPEIHKRGFVKKPLSELLDSEE